MRYYCKAYQLKDLKSFKNWMVINEADESELTDEDVVYLCDDFTVIRSPIIPESGVVFDRTTPEWQKFCKTALHFEIPEDLRYIYE